SYHPAREVQVTLAGRAEMTLDSDHLLLTDEAMPAAQGLGVARGILVILGHVPTHDLRSVFGNVQPGPEPVLGAHAGCVLGINRVPSTVVRFTQRLNCLAVLVVL